MPGGAKGAALIFLEVGLYKNGFLRYTLYQMRKEVPEMGVGFIRDKLEIKFLILYIAARVSETAAAGGYAGADDVR